MLIGFTLQYLEVAVMPLVPETKMADIAKLIDLRNLLAWRTTWLMLRNTSTTSILSRVFRAYSMTRILYKYFVFQHSSSFSPFYLQGQGQHTLFSVTSREKTLTLSISTHRSNTLPPFYIWLPAVNCHKNVYTMQPFSSLLHFFSETFSSLEHRNIVKPQKETNSRNT